MISVSSMSLRVRAARAFRFGAGVALALLAAMPAGAQRLFRTTAPLEVTFTTDLRTLVRDRDSTKFKPHGAVFAYKETDGKVVELPVTLQTRGHFRRQAKNCDFPPLSMVVKKKASDNTVLQGNTKLKVASSCRPRTDDYEQYILQEYALYRLYQRISPLHFRTRLAKITYKDSLAKTPDVVSWGFFIEDDKEVAKEFNTATEKTKGALFDQLDQPQLVTSMLFQYMVGNTDYSVTAQHNIALLRDSTATIIKTVAYDFDWSGAVGTRYAFPNEKLGIKTIYDRLYRGPCLTVAQWQPHLTKFVAARPAIDSIYNSIPGLEPKRVKSSNEWFDGFYKTLADPRAFKRDLVDRCERDGN
ncbi:MAG: hypothetical protein H7Z40_06820 [Phycisphaerae bacterium]|nr:hypothetical protein [Gemmatimonadaceae bacterium]